MPDSAKHLADVYQEAYFTTRFTPSPMREAVWRHVNTYLKRYWDLPAAGSVLELGAGYGYWIKQITAADKHALDLCPQLAEMLAAADAADVQPHVQPCTDLSPWADESLHLVVASNLLEHLSVPEGLACMNEVYRVLRAGGQFCVIQPNFALCPRQYFDDFTHQSIYTHASLVDMVETTGLVCQQVWPRFLPFSMFGKPSGLACLVPIYLRSPIKPLAGQFCALFRKPAVSDKPANISN